METQLVELDWRLKCDKCGIRPQSDVNPAASHQGNPLNYQRDLGGLGGLKTNSIGNWMYRTKGQVPCPSGTCGCQLGHH